MRTAAESRVLVRQWLIGLALLLAAAAPLAYSAVVVPLPAWQQAEVGVAIVAMAAALARRPSMRPFIIFLSAFVSMRYFYWRIHSTLNLDNSLDTTVSLLLLIAESYGLLILFLGYFQTIESTERQPPPLDRAPSVDVFIPTYNEPVEIVRRTAIGALAIEYPAKRVYVLDDGKRPEIAAMARELGCEYATRPDNSHAKAGNLNHALAITSGELVCIFDADHVPVRSFLQKTVGFFADPAIALVQSAQHFFNPDPYERNLALTDRIAPEQMFFYRVIQRGNDFWNSAFFCGSCAVLRRSALLAIGGFRTQTVTEDAHTSLELHSRGLRSVYLAQPLAAGLATETFAAHVKQRIRWARGMAQILRLDCPLFKRGLSLPQRVNYFNAMLHFFFGVPRLILILAPLTYLLLGAHPIKADALAVLAYILPHIGCSTLANSIASKQYRHSFWSGVYEISIAPFVAGVTLLALLNPRLGKFNVTDKGSRVSKAWFDFRTSRATLALIALNVIGLTLAFPLRLWFSQNHPAELDSAMLNSAWAVGNLILLLAAACVAYEQPQERRAPRVARRWASQLEVEGEQLEAATVDISESGCRVRLAPPAAVPATCSLRLQDGEGRELRLPARRVWCDWGQAGAVEAAFEFEPMDPATSRALIEMIFCGDRSWAELNYAPDRIWRSFGYLVATFWRITRPRVARHRRAPVVRGPWMAEWAGVKCRCAWVSALEAELIVDSPAQLPSAGALTVTMNGRSAQVPAASLRRSGRRVLIDFNWAGWTEMRQFSEILYRTGSKTAAVSLVKRESFANVP